MPTSPIKKNDFLELVAGDFLARNPGWRRSLQKKREYLLTVGREVDGACFVWLCFSCRPDRYWFGLSVGWSPTEEAHIRRLELRENPPVYPNDGSLRRIRTLEHVRQCELPEMSRTVSGLYMPYQDYNLETTPPESVKALMLDEIGTYAFPYLRLMLHSRHALELSDEQLAGCVELEG
jgi:hypothetical protein